LLALVLAAGIWWLYFELVGHRPARKGLLYTYVRNYVHLPLSAAITAVGAGVFTVVGREGEHLPAAHRALVAGGLSVALLCIAIVSRVSMRPKVDVRSITAVEHATLAAALGCAIVAFVGDVSPLVVLAILAAMVFVVDAFGVAQWTHEHPGDPWDEADEARFY
jgi:low temperature requirement protein LtrA